jgi:hypothetical protein
MPTVTLILMVFGFADQPVVLTTPQPDMATCERERAIERRLGVRRPSGLEVHALCTSEPIRTIASEWSALS